MPYVPVPSAPSAAAGAGCPESLFSNEWLIHEICVLPAGRFLQVSLEDTGANNSYGGGTNLNAGTLNAGSANALGSSGTISFGGGTLQYSAANQADYSARFSTAANQAYRIDTNGQNVTLASALSSTDGTLTKTGTGTLTLLGANTYSGTTTVSAGTLNVGGGGSTGSIANSAVINNANFMVDRSDAIALASLVGGTSITGTGNITVRSNAGVNINRTINLSGANSTITLLAGNATVAGTASGGDVTLSNTITTSSAGTVTIFSGNAATSALDAQISGATGGKAKTYNVATAATSAATAGARNIYYRVAPTITVSGITGTTVNG